MRLKLLISLAGVVLAGFALVMVVVRSCGSSQANLDSTPLENHEPGAFNAATHSAAQASQLKFVPRLVASVVQVPPANTGAHDEDALMAALHELGESNPTKSLQLAREGNQRFPSGAGAAERGWIVCKSLTTMELFDEAREEAKTMVQKYPGTNWANDVTKHILINPGTHPTERGHGKKYELE